MADRRATFALGRVVYYDGESKEFENLNSLLELFCDEPTVVPPVRQLELAALMPEGGTCNVVFDFNSITFGSRPEEDNVFRHQKLLGEILLENRILSAEQLQQALEEQRKSQGKERLGSVLIRLGFSSAREIYQSLRTQFGLPAM